MEKAVRDDIELEIAFLSSGQRQEEFLYEGVKYHSIAPYSSGNYFIFRLTWDSTSPLQYPAAVSVFFTIISFPIVVFVRWLFAKIDPDVAY